MGLDLRDVITLATSLLGTAAGVLIALGRYQERFKGLAEENGRAHSALEKNLQLATRRIDTQGEKIIRLEADRDNTMALLRQAMDSSTQAMARLEGALGETNRRIDALLAHFKE